MDTNIIYNIDCVAGMNQMIDEASIDLIIADPPYFKVIGEKWDYLWRTEEDYLEWSEKWIAEAARVLRMGGSFYLFGYFRMLSRLLPILEKYGFELRQQIVLNKGMQAVSGRATKNYRMFPNVTESILFLCKDPKPFAKSFLKQRQKELGYSAKQINEMLGVKSNGGGNVKKCAVGKHPKSEKLGSTGQAACCARIHSRYFTGGNPSGLRV